jgi:hypothetical protein
VLRLCMDTDCVQVRDTKVCIGDEFEVIREMSPLLGRADKGEVFEVVSVETTPSGPEAVVEYDSDGREYCFSPTSLKEALGMAKYPSAPDEPCIKPKEGE